MTLTRALSGVILLLFGTYLLYSSLTVSWSQIPPFYQLLLSEYLPQGVGVISIVTGMYFLMRRNTKPLPSVIQEQQESRSE